MLKSIFKIGLFGIIAASMISCGNSENGKIGVIDLPLLYSSFDYQKELEVKFNQIGETFNILEDSLTTAIGSIEQAIDNSTEYTNDEKNILFERAYVDYLSEQEYLEYQKDSISDNYSGKVWNQLNSYMKDYGDENNYDVIIGMQGHGNVMYVKEGIDITEDVIVYSNKKYNGE